jgi:hypothetical protein
VLGRFKSAIEDRDLAADENYHNAWMVEHDPRNVREVPILDKETGGPIIDPNTGQAQTMKMRAPVDMADVQDALTPFAEQYEYTLSATDAHASLGLKVMRQIIDGPRFKPISQAERDLSLLKEAARTEKGMAQLRDVSQGLAAKSVAELQQQIDATMGQLHYPGGRPGQGLQYLQEGRKATAQKWDIYDLARQEFGNRDLSAIEPVQAFRRLTWGQDSGIEGLRQVARIAPGEMRAVGRAFIDNGGDWGALGPETKKVLVRDPQTIQELDAYYGKKQQFEPLTKLEPVQLFNRLTSSEDQKIGLLRSVAQQAPQSMPEFARAYIDSGGAWDKLGAQTKLALVRDPQLI